MPDHERKILQFKGTLGDTGTVKAVFATLGVVDHDGDIIMPGAIVNGTAVRLSAYNHKSWSDSMPIGRGTIAEIGNELIFDGQFFMDVQSAADTFKTVKNLAELGEWSFGFDVLEKEYSIDQATGVENRRIKKMAVYEVSPVLLGAGIATRTLDMKSMGAGSTTYQEHAEELKEAVADFVKRSQSIADLRTEKGKEPASVKNRDGLKAIAVELTTAASELTRIAITDVEADEKKSREEVAAMFAQFDTDEIMRS